MASNIESYQQLLAWLGVGPDDLRLIRQTLFDRIFPGGLETRSVIKFRYVVVPLILDIMDSFFPATCCIEANAYFFDLLNQVESRGEAHIDLDLAANFMRYLAGLVVLGPNRIAADVVSDVTNQCFPGLTVIFAADGESRGPSAGYVPFERFLFNLTSLLVSHCPISPAITDVLQAIDFGLVLRFGCNNPDLVVPRPRSPNSSSNSTRTRLEILRENDQFGNDSLCLTMDSTNSSDRDEPVLEEPVQEESVGDEPAGAPQPENSNDPPDSRARVVSRTVLGGVCIFNAIFDFSQVQVQEPGFNWFKVTAPTRMRTGPDGEFLLGYHNIEGPVFQYADKKLTRNVGLQIWPNNPNVSTQTDVSAIETTPANVAGSNDNAQPSPSSSDTSPEEYLAFQAIDTSKADRQELVLANIELDK